MGYNAPKLQTATTNSIKVQVIISLTMKTGTLQLCTCIGVVENLAGGVLLGTAHIDGCMNGIFLVDGKIVSIQSAPVSTLSKDKDMSNISILPSCKTSNLGLE